MKRYLIFLLAVFLIVGLFGCKAKTSTPTVAATTLPVYEFTARLCAGTEIHVTHLITENVSCLHDYTLQVSQMKSLESADSVIVSGAGLEEFMEDILKDKSVIDASENIPLLCVNHEHSDHGHNHHHEDDPHIWLAPNNAKVMAKNICEGLCRQYPQYTDILTKNLRELDTEFDALQNYGTQILRDVRCRNLMTFHDGFGYLAQAFDLTILHAMEEESGREASAAELIEMCSIVKEHHLPAIFTERHGSVSAASVISRETEAKIYQLDMAMGNGSYFDTMYRNIDTLKEALE